VLNGHVAVTGSLQQVTEIRHSTEPRIP